MKQSSNAAIEQKTFVPITLNMHNVCKLNNKDRVQFLSLGEKCADSNIFSISRSLPHASGTLLCE